MPLVYIVQALTSTNAMQLEQADACSLQMQGQLAHERDLVKCLREQLQVSPYYLACVTTLMSPDITIHAHCDQNCM